VKVFQMLIGLVWCFSTMSSGCKIAELPTDNVENFDIDSIKVFSPNNEPLYVNYNINGGRIDALVENDGISGKFFNVKFVFPKGITPLSITPDMSKPIDFKVPVIVDIQYTKAIKKTYTFTLNEEPLNPAKYFIERVDVLNDDNSASNIKLSQAGNDYIGLSYNQSAGKRYRLKLTFPSKITPLSISPDPNALTDLSKEVIYTVKYDDQVSKTYSVKIGNYNTNTFTRKIVRGVWVSDVGSDVFATKANITECVNICKDIGINTIFVVTYNDAKTKYKSQVMKDYMGVEIDPKYAGRDPLAEMIEAAKPHGIKVVAWFEYGFASVYGDNSGGALVAKYPSWASRDAAGNITEKNKFYWLDAFNPEVQQFVTDLIMEIVDRYEVDGIQVDDHFGFPVEFGYDDYTIKLYQSEHNGQSPPTDYRNAEWVQWRADKITAYVGTLYQRIKQSHPLMIFSVSPNPQGFSLQAFLLDWYKWYQQKNIDELIVQVYRNNLDSFQKELAQPELIAAKGNIAVGIGVLAGLKGRPVSLEQITSQVNTVREQGFSGVSFFFYESLCNLGKESPEERQNQCKILFPG
jgi:uncharacterized lipoprotein YddW (UPF0748 family)